MLNKNKMIEEMHLLIEKNPCMVRCIKSLPGKNAIKDKNYIITYNERDYLYHVQDENNIVCAAYLTLANFDKFFVILNEHRNKKIDKLLK